MNARAFEHGPSAPVPGELSRGYQWKALFLPDGTELRMTTSSQTYYARVVGDRIIYLGRSLSPRGFTLATAGEGRNAWRDLWLRLPGERFWKGANRCRIEAQRMQAQPELSPHESMRIAAAALTQALEAALALVHSGARITQAPPERRAGLHRRESDVLGQACAFD